MNVVTAASCSGVDNLLGKDKLYFEGRKVGEVLDLVERPILIDELSGHCSVLTHERILSPTSLFKFFRYAAKLCDRHPTDAGAALVVPPLAAMLPSGFSITYLLHDSRRVGWAFGLTQIPQHRHRSLHGKVCGGLGDDPRREMDLRPLVAHRGVRSSDLSADFTLIFVKNPMSAIVLS